MKQNDFIKEINKQDFLWCKNKSIYSVLYKGCLLVFLENADKLNTQKEYKQGKNSVVLNETKEIQAINIKELTPAGRTGDIITEKDRVLERISSGTRDMWFDTGLLKWFSPSAKYYFFEDGWHKKQLYIVEKNKIVAMLLKVSDDYIQKVNSKKKGRK